jgi:DNA-binding NarL/FixJ family response regulator
LNAQFRCANYDPAVRILLVDDHNLFRAGLRSLREEEEGFDVVDADGGEAASYTRACRRRTSS